MWFWGGGQTYTRPHATSSSKLQQLQQQPCQQHLSPAAQLAVALQNGQPIAAGALCWWCLQQCSLDAEVACRQSLWQSLPASIQCTAAEALTAAAVDVWAMAGACERACGQTHQCEAHSTAAEALTAAVTHSECQENGSCMCRVVTLRWHSKHPHARLLRRSAHGYTGSSSCAPTGASCAATTPTTTGHCPPLFPYITQSSHALLSLLPPPHPPRPPQPACGTCSASCAATTRATDPPS